MMATPSSLRLDRACCPASSPATTIIGLRPKRCRRPCRPRPRSSPWLRRARALGSVPVSTKLRPASTPAAARCGARLRPMHAGGAQLCDALRDCAAPRRIGRCVAASTGPTSWHGKQRCLVGGHQRIEAAEMAREIPRRRLADVPDAEREDEARQRRRLALLDRGDARSPRSCRPSAPARRAWPVPACRSRPACARCQPSTSWSTSLSPRPSMSIARRLAKCSSACLRCAGHTRPPVQRAMASSGSRATAEPHSGQVEGITNWRRAGRTLFEQRRGRLRESRRRRGARPRYRRCGRPCGGPRPRCAAWRW